MSATDLSVDRDDAVRLARLFLHAAVPNTIIDAAEDRTPSAPPVRPRIGWLERFDRWTARLRQRDRERYLALSTDIFDLERRLRALERRPYY